jgi:uncharacterized protein YecT (DUF1311 family)
MEERMKMWLRSSIWTIAIYGSVIASGQELTLNKSPCKDPRTTVEMKKCAWERLKSADAELNRVYNNLIGKIDDPQHKALLVKAQTAWIKYRDLNTNFESYFYNGGSAKEQIKVYAMARMTEARSQEIRSIIDCEFNR